MIAAQELDFVVKNQMKTNRPERQTNRASEQVLFLQEEYSSRVKTGVLVDGSIENHIKFYGYGPFFIQYKYTLLLYVTAWDKIAGFETHSLK